MKLINAQVTDYKCIDDSNSVEFGQVTCFVGKNESGKTTFLQALAKLNPLEGSGTFGELDYPRKRLRDYRAKKADEESVVAVTATFELTKQEMEKLEAEFGEGVLSKHTFTVSKYYEDAKQYFSLPINEKKVLSHFLSAQQLSADTAKKIAASTTVADLRKQLKALTEITPEEQQLLAKLQERFPESVSKSVIAKVSIPKFFYFDDYSIMVGTVGVNHLASKTPEQYNDGEKTFSAFLKCAGTKIQDFQNPDNYEKLKAELEAASNAITDDIFEYWQQNKNLSVEIDISDAYGADRLPGDAGKALRVRIKNLKHQVTVPFDDRSKGFVWFFSFMVYFSQLKQKAGEVILLLDEPGLNLHARAQEDFLRLIEERLAPKYQVVYSTHSPFMIPTQHFDWVRTVEDVDTKGTKISSDALKNSRDTVFPIQGALGYDLAQSLFIGKDNLLVEGPSDLIYLQAMGIVTEDKGHTSLDPRWVTVPVGGADKISVFVTLLGANKLNVAVLRDFASNEKQRIDALVKNGFLKNEKLVLLNEFNGGKDSDIEDLFGEAFYVELVNQAYEAVLKKPMKLSDLPPGGRIVKRIEQHINDNALLGPDRRFNHYKPAVYLQRELATLAGKVPKPAVEAFAAIFERLNGFLSGKKQSAAARASENA
jgi:predicted ATP-dependent endonuclease of OLD family